jgi:TldD protein
VTAGYSDGTEAKVFANRTKLVTEVLRRTRLMITIFVSDGHQRRYDWLLRGGTGGLELLPVADADLEQVRDVAVALLSARPVPAGTYDVVTDPSITGVLAHEAFGHGVETDMFLKQRARGADYIGRRVGAPLVTIVDDPTVPGGYGSYFVDDEGQPATPTRIIEAGILQRGLTDLYSATRLGLARSANGRRESFARKAYARMSNTFFAPGPHTVQQVLDSLEDGLLLCQASSGMEDPKGWGIQVSAHYAREYRGGKPTGVLYSPISLTGYVPDVLHNVSMVADDFHLHPGGCGKGWKEYITVGDGGPHLRTRVRLG